MLIPLLIGLGVAALLWGTTHWWGFLVIFPWIGLSISFGLWLRRALPKNKRRMGRRVAILLVMPMLLLFVPLINRENFQLEGIVLLLLAGFLGKGVIHYAIAKIFGPLVWGRGFCGWACWTAAVLEWLPIKKTGVISARLKNIRFAALAASVVVPVSLVFFFNFDVYRSYLYRQELQWMMAGNALYYLVAIPLAFMLKDRRAFCKIACPVSLVMKVPSALAAIKMAPTDQECTECGACNKQCPMDIDVMAYIKQGRKVTSTECILCDECQLVCPTGAIK